MSAIRSWTLTFSVSIVIGGMSAAGLGQTASAPVPSLALVEEEHAPIPFSIALKSIPNWSGGALVIADNTSGEYPRLHAFGRDGALLSELSVEIPDSSRVFVRGFKRAFDGTLALVGAAFSPDYRRASFLAVISPGGQHQRIVRLSSFEPYEVAIAPDGSYWVAGEEDSDSPDHTVLRRFSASGQQLGAYLPLSGLKTYRCCHPGDDSFLMSSRDRIAWYSNVAREYVELSPEGKVLARVPGLALEQSSRVDGLGICDDGSVFISAFLNIAPGDRSSEILSLDRSSSSWKPVVLKNSGVSAYRPVSYRPVLGCDGDKLVTQARWPDELMGLSWSRQQ